MQKRSKFSATRSVVFTALMTALVTLATVVLGFPAGDFFFNCGDAVIFVTAAILGPVPAMFAGGIGSFFADLAVYPATMVFTLFIKGVEGLVCGLLMRLLSRVSSRGLLGALFHVLSMAVAGTLMMTGYFVCNSFIYGTPAVCNSFIYGTPASALAALPADAVQWSLSLAIATALLYGLRLIAFRDKLGFAPVPRHDAPPYRRVPHTGERSDL